MKSGCSAKAILVLLMIVLCITSLVLVWAMASIPRQVEQRFGAPSAALDSIKRLTYGGQLLLYEKDLLTPLSSNPALTDFEIQPGDSANMVAQRLEENGFIRNAEAFRLYLVYAGMDTSIQAGNFKIGPGMTAVEIARLMQDNVPGEVILGILPGWRAEEIAASLEYSGLTISKEAFLSIAYTPEDTSLPEKFRGLVSLEGFLMPGEYQVSREITAQELIAVILNNFETKVTPELQERYTSLGLDLNEAVTLASLVQREAVVVREQPIIASVFYNRLQAGMKLDSDPTAQYALGYQRDTQTWWKMPLYTGDLQVDSPYNTYQNIGLPPGAICNPSLSALEAVAYPADTPYYYFRAKCDQSGEHNFSVTFDEHLQNGCP